MKNRQVNGNLLFYEELFFTTILIMAMVFFKQTACSNSIGINDRDDDRRETHADQLLNSEHKSVSSMNLEFKVEHHTSELEGIFKRLHHLENHVTVLNNQSKEQKEKIAMLESIVDHLQTNHKEEEEPLLESSIENEIKLPHKRVKRQNKSINPSSIPPPCKKEVCAFDYSRNTTLQLTKSAAYSLESVALPNDCNTLARLGHSLSGIYAVKGNGENGNKVALTYCHFNSPLLLKNKDVPPVLEKQLGFFEIKSLPNRVAFFAQKTDPSPSSFEVVSFTSLLLNVGGAMDLSTGIFTAPVPGTYSFHFSGIGKNSMLYVSLLKNDNLIGNAYYDGVGGGHGTLVLSAVVKLVAGDKMYLKKSDGDGFIQDNENRHTVFSGFLIDEDLTF